jgi:hypothetical protein
VPISLPESLVVAFPPIQSPSSRTFVELTLVTQCCRPLAEAVAENHQAHKNHVLDLDRNNIPQPCPHNSLRSNVFQCNRDSPPPYGLPVIAILTFPATTNTMKIVGADKSRGVNEKLDFTIPSLKHADSWGRMTYHPVERSRGTMCQSMKIGLCQKSELVDGKTTGSK